MVHHAQKRLRVLRLVPMESALTELAHVPKDTVGQTALLLPVLGGTGKFAMDGELVRKMPQV